MEGKRTGGVAKETALPFATLRHHTYDGGGEREQEARREGEEVADF